MRSRVFLLSPATAHGTKARTLVEEPPRTPVARQLRTREGVSLGAVFTHLSGLYFAGKLAYARAFAHPPAVVSGSGIYVVTFAEGLLDPETRVHAAMLRRLGAVGEVDEGVRDRLVRSTSELACSLGDAECEVVLLGSVQSTKYTEVLEPVFGDALRVPRELVRRGHLQRGALLLECAASGRELEYIGLEELRTILATVRHRRSGR